MRTARLTRWITLAIVLTLLSGCSTPFAGPTATPIPPSDMPQPTPIPATETPIPTETSVPTITPTPGPVVIDDDFSTDAGRFKCDNCVVSDGELVIGPFPMVDSYKPFTVLCADCGSFKNYKMSADIWYVSGNSQFGYGLVVREDSKTSYLVAVSSWLVYNVFSFDLSSASKGGIGYKSLIHGWAKGGLVAGRGINRVEIVMKDNAMSIAINGNNIRVLDMPSGSGQVGLWVGNWETSAGFDNFHFEEIR